MDIETFEDFSSEEGDEGEFSDDDIVNVLDLMSETATLASSSSFHSRSTAKKSSLRREQPISTLANEKFTSSPSFSSSSSADVLLQQLFASVSLLPQETPPEVDDDGTSLRNERDTMLVGGKNDSDLDMDSIDWFEDVYGQSRANAELSSPNLMKINDACCETVAQTSNTLNERLGLPSISHYKSSICHNLPDEISAQMTVIYEKILQNSDGFNNLVAICRDTLRISADTSYSEGQINLDGALTLNAFKNFVVGIEERLDRQGFASHFASTRLERLELVLVALDQRYNVLPPTLKLKWTKTLDSMGLFAEMFERKSLQMEIKDDNRQFPLEKDQCHSVTPVSDDTHSTSSSMTSDKVMRHAQNYQLMTWGKFMPDKMPIQLSSQLSERTHKKGPYDSESSNKCKFIKHMRPPKQRRKMISLPELELTFRPKINAGRSRGRGIRNKEAFTLRMEKDIYKRRQTRLEQDQEREKRLSNTSPSPVKSLIAKGSQRILQRNGLWEEPTEKRLKRLLMRGNKSKYYMEDRQRKRMQERRQHRKLQTAAISSRACESLYQRGLEKRIRDDRRQQDDIQHIRQSSEQIKMSKASHVVMKRKIRHALNLVCCRETEKSEMVETRKSRNVAFVEFSCALLFFGLVPDLNTPCPGNPDITLLWHVWTTIVNAHGQTSESMKMEVLETLLDAVILGDKLKNVQLTSTEVNVLRLLRTNYLSRTRTKAVNFRDLGTPQSINTSSGVAEKSVNSQRLPPKYSLHGKPMASANSNANPDPLSEREHLREKRLRQLRELKEKQEIAECTFRPQINHSTHTTRVKADIEEINMHYGRATASSTKKAFERLYDDAFDRHNHVLEKYLLAKQQHEEVEKRERAISPGYVNGQSIEERLHKLQETLANSALPVNFYQKIKAMRAATDKKAAELEEKTSRLLPAHFKRSKDRRTIVVPFHFATDKRAKRLSENRELSSTCRPRKSTKQMFNYRAATHQLMDNSPTMGDEISTSFKTADLCVDVHLSPGETYQLYLNTGVDPKLVTDTFARRYNLSSPQRSQLHQLVAAKLEEFLQFQV